MLVGEIQKSATDKIMVSVSEYKNHTFLDVRVYFENDNGEWKPTKKGITISRDTIEPLIKLLNEGKTKPDGV